MSERELEQFCQAVLAEPALQKPLRETPDLPAFIDQMLALGAERGYTFTAEEIQAKLRAMRQAWIERWIV